MAMTLQELRNKAAKGDILTLDELKQFVDSTRVSYKAAESKVKTPSTPDAPKLSRTKKETPKDVDFF